MARPEGITFRGDNYLPDWTTEEFKYSYTLKIPDGLSAAEIDAIINVVGGEIAPESSKGIPCDDSEGFPWTPRKLKFWFSTGKTVSMPVPNKEDLVTVSAAIATSLSTIANVVCVSLEGETWRNIIDKLASPTTPIVPVPLVVTPTPAGQKEQSYVGTMSYESDGQTNMNKAFKMASDRGENLPYLIYEDAINNCLVAGGAINTSQGRCSGFTSRTFDHRRFAVTMLQTRNVISGGDGGTAEEETTEAKSRMLVPMSSRDSADINACAIALRDVSSTICLGYRGEWDKRFSNRNPAALP